MSPAVAAGAAAAPGAGGAGSESFWCCPAQPCCSLPCCPSRPAALSPNPLQNTLLMKAINANLDLVAAVKEGEAGAAAGEQKEGGGRRGREGNDVEGRPVSTGWLIYQAVSHDRVQVPIGKAPVRLDSQGSRVEVQKAERPGRLGIVATSAPI